MLNLAVTNTKKVSAYSIQETLFLFCFFFQNFATQSYTQIITVYSHTYILERKALKWCTSSPDDPKTSMELNCSVEMRMATGAFSIHSPFGEFLLLCKKLPSSHIHT